jgi:hypothetical protein
MKSQYDVTSENLNTDWTLASLDKQHDIKIRGNNRGDAKLLGEPVPEASHVNRGLKDHGSQYLT